MQTHLKDYIEDKLEHYHAGNQLPEKYVKFINTDREQFIITKLKAEGGFNDIRSYNSKFIYSIMKEHNISVDTSSFNAFAYSLLKFSEGAMHSVGLQAHYFELIGK